MLGGRAAPVLGDAGHDRQLPARRVGAPHATLATSNGAATSADLTQARCAARARLPASRPRCDPPPVAHGERATSRSGKRVGSSPRAIEATLQAA
jgi:hypothetical protein